MATDISNNETFIDANTPEPALQITQTGSGTPLRVQDQDKLGSVIYVRDPNNPATSLQTVTQDAQIAENLTERNSIVNSQRSFSGEYIYSKWKRYTHRGAGAFMYLDFNGNYVQNGTSLVSLTWARQGGCPGTILQNDFGLGEIIEVFFTSGAAQTSNGFYAVVNNTNNGDGTNTITINTSTPRFANGTCTIRARESFATWNIVNVLGRQVIQSTSNSCNVVGLLSDLSYQSYILDVIISSTAGDNDLAGITLAFNNDNILTLNRHGGGMAGPQWGIVYNYQSPNGGQITLSDRAAQITGFGNWNTISGGVRILVIRNENIFTITTTIPSNIANYWVGRTWANIVASGEIDDTFNFDINSNPNTTQFSIPCPFGFFALSQANTRFNIEQFTVISPIYRIDITPPQVSTYNIGTATWNPEVPVVNFVQQFGANRFVHDSYTKKTYIVNPIANNLTAVGKEFANIQEDNRDLGLIQMLTPTSRFVMTNPDGNRYSLIVDNAPGAVPAVTTALL